jgi:hypothetical protein
MKEGRRRRDGGIPRRRFGARAEARSAVLFLLGGCAALGLAFSRELGPAGEEEEERESDLALWREPRAPRSLLSSPGFTTPCAAVDISVLVTPVLQHKQTAM